LLLAWLEDLCDHEDLNGTRIHQSQSHVVRASGARSPTVPWSTTKCTPATAESIDRGRPTIEPPFHRTYPHLHASRLLVGLFLSVNLLLPLYRLFFQKQHSSACISTTVQTTRFTEVLRLLNNLFTEHTPPLHADRLLVDLFLSMNLLLPLYRLFLQKQHSSACILQLFKRQDSQLFLWPFVLKPQPPSDVAFQTLSPGSSPVLLADLVPPARDGHGSVRH
jgi:hypothetical protein